MSKHKFTRAKRPIEQRLADKISHIPIVGCDIWTGTIAASGGYGIIKYTGKTTRVHRLVWEFKNGKIPHGMYICHRCDTPACCNPHHMFLGTPQDNTDDMMAKGRGFSLGATNPAMGEKCNLSKLTAAQVREIRSLAKNGLSHGVIAAQIGVSRPNISVIVSRKSWKHI